MKLTLSKWNDLIEKVNALVPDCPDVSPLEQVEAPHKWSKADIREVQDKLRELCDQNEFDDIPNKWKQRIIDEIEDAISQGACCCEPKTINANFPFGFGSYGAPQGINRSENSLLDWGSFIDNGDGTPFTQFTTECAMNPDGSTPTYAYFREGGPYFYGSQYNTWNLDVVRTLGGNEVNRLTVASGDVIDGYIDVVNWRPNHKCGESPEGGIQPSENPPPVYVDIESIDGCNAESHPENPVCFAEPAEIFTDANLGEITIPLSSIWSLTPIQNVPELPGVVNVLHFTATYTQVSGGELVSVDGPYDSHIELNLEC